MYDVERHSKAIYEIVSARSQQRGTVFLDFSDEGHYRCITEMFGGKDRFKEGFPNHYLLAQNTSINLKGGANALIGAGYDDGYMGFKKAFSGYIDYIAEFEKALDASRIAAYADNPPFIFDKDLISSISLSSANPSELVYDEAIWGYGDFRYVLAESTNPVGSPQGIEYFYPTEKDPLWDTLSLEDQWKIKYYCTYIDTVVNKVLGLSRQHHSTTVGMDPDLATTGTTGLMRRRVTARVDLHRPNPQNLEAQLEPLLRNSGGLRNRRAPRINGNGFNGAIGGGAVVMAAGATGSASCSGYFVAAIAALGVFVAVSAVLVVVFYNRPEPAEADLRIRSLRFNNDGDSTTGSLNCRKDSATTVPVKAAKNPASGKIEITGVFVPADLTRISLTVEVYCEKGSGLTGRIKAIESTPIVGDLTSDRFTINSGETKSIHIDIDPAKLKAASQGKVKNFGTNWEWAFAQEKDETFLTNSAQTIYTVSARPLSPWICTRQSYNEAEIGYIWTDILDICCSAYKRYSDPAAGLPGDLEHVRAYTLELNNNKAFQYDKKNGASYYVTDFNTIKLQKYLHDRMSASAKTLNCTDCANIVAMEAVASGIDCTMGIMTFPGGFLCNQIQAIGYSNWEIPFPPGGGFSYHQVAVIGSAERSRSSSIFDACLKLDAGSYPGKPESSTYTKTRLLPVDYAFSETADLRVNVPLSTAYHKPYYRERLVRDQSKCGLLSNPISVGGIAARVAGRAASMEEEEYREFLEMVKKRFGLEENPLPKKSGVSAPSLFPDFQKIAGIDRFELEEDYGEQKVYSGVRNGNSYRVDLHKAADEQKAFSVLTRRLAFITNPGIQRRAGLGDIAFAIDDSYIVAVRSNVVISVAGKQAAQLAKDLLEQLS